MALSQHAHFLVVEDEPLVRRSLAKMMRKHGEVVLAANAREAMALLPERPTWDAFVVDLRLPGRNGLQLLGDLRQKYPGTPALLLTGYVEGEVVNAAYDMGVEVLGKPADPDRMTRFLHDAALARAPAARSVNWSAELRGRIHELGALVRSAHDVSARHAIGAIVVELKAHPDLYGEGAVASAAAVLEADLPTFYRYATVAECWSRAELDAILARKGGDGRSLSWSHLVALAAAASKRERERYLERALKDGLSVRALTLMMIR